MAWRDQLQPASFRGVPFHVAGTDGQIGRRQAVHEYPFRDLPYVEDLGRKAREFTLEAFVIGDDYMTARDALIAALEKSGSGELVHPYRGRSQVAVTQARLSETSAEGGMARFSITFTESGEPVNPAPKTDTGHGVNSAADAAQAASESSFADVFSVEGFQDFVADSGLSTIGQSINGLRLTAQSMISNTILPEFLLQLTGISNDLTYLMRSPGTLANGLFGQVRGLSSLANGPISALQSLRSLFVFGDTLKPVTGTTPSRQQQARNQAAVIRLTRQAAMIEAARVATKIQPANYEEAIALRDDLAGHLEIQAETADDAIYTALTDLRIAVIKDINSRAADLSRTVQYPLSKTQPALVIAHRLYGSIDQADAIVARNKVRHPGFVPGGRSIEVMTP